MLVGSIAVVIALIGGLLVYSGLGDEAPGGEVFLEPVQSTGIDPFLGETAALVDIEPVLLPEAKGEAVEDKPTQSFAGTDFGLYGGTLDNARCNRLQLVEFLEATPDKASAWARVQGIDPSRIRELVDSFTPVVLLKDTRVTNHGFRDGRATVLQSVLQAGTAVLVDEEGMPRVRCACGNPLAKPIPQSRTIVVGPAWDGFNPDQVQVVAPGLPTGDFVLQNLEGGIVISRPVGTSGGQDQAASASVIGAISADLLVPELGDPARTVAVGGVVIPSPTEPYSDTATPFVGGDVESIALPVPSEDDETQATIGSQTADEQTATSAPPTTLSEAEAVASESSPTPTTAKAPTTARASPTTAPATTIAPTTTIATTTTIAPTTTTTVPTTAAAPAIVSISSSGSVSANSSFPGYPASNARDGSAASSWFSTGPGAGPGVFTWSAASHFISQVSFQGNGSNSNPDFRSGFGFSSVRIDVLSGGAVVYTASGSGYGSSFSPGVVGDQVRLTFTGHDSADCGGFAELYVSGYAAP